VIRWVLVAVSLLLTLPLGACGDLPQPFFGRPGTTAAQLARQPPPARLVVPAPGDSLLGDEASAAWAGAVVKALQDREVPALRGNPARGDWSLVLSARVRGAAVVPAYEVRDAGSKAQGSVEGAPVPLKAWASADQVTLRASADGAAPKVIKLLTRIEAAQIKADPNSLVNRTARVFFAGVTGAPGDGNRSIAAQMRTKLANQGIVVQDSAAGADFRLDGQVATAPGDGGQTRVEVGWLVQDAQGRERGRIVQLNDVPAASITRYWGDVATAVAEQAASGMGEVLQQAGATHRGVAARSGASENPSREGSLRP
jgi:hypothetical protein